MGSQEKKSSLAPVATKPQKNASNNVNGDEFNKVHGAEGGFFCQQNCASCKYQVQTNALNALKGNINPVETFIYKNEKVETEQFSWLMEHLLPPNPAKFKGCELIFPDTAFFENGLCKSIIKNDEDYCLTQVKNPAKLSCIKLLTDFQAVIRERRNDQNGVFSQIYHKNFQLQAINKL